MTTTIKFATGMVFTLEGKMYEITSANRYEIRVRNTETGTFGGFTPQNLRPKFRKGEAVMIQEN